MPAQAKNGKALLIVESPSKVKTISGYLGEDYLVDSSMVISVTFHSPLSCPKT